MCGSSKRSQRQQDISHDYIGVVGRITEPDPSSGGGAVGGGERTEPRLVGERGRPGSAAVRPLVLPEPFDGVGSWSDWWFHFENVSTVNGWDDSQKLQWLRVRLTGRAQKALHRLPGPVASSYEATRDARF